MKRKSSLIALLLVLSMVIGACTAAPAATSTAAPNAAPTAAAAKAVDLASIGIDCSQYSEEISKGPNGEAPTSFSDVTLTEEDYAKLKEGNYKAAMLWAGAGEWYNGLTDGATAEFEKMGIEVVATADAQFDPAKQATDVENAMALDPDIILTLVIDPVSGEQAYKPAVDEGVVLVLADNGVDNYKAGEQYVGIVTGNHFGMGRGSADLMAEALGGKGNIGFIYHDADYFVTNNRDRAFACWIQSKYPDIHIVAAGGFSEEARTEEVASTMLTQHPELNGIYVAWDVAAEGVIAALRSANRTDVKVITEDLGATNDLDMAQGGSMYGKTIDMAFVIGQKMAQEAGLKLLGKTTHPFVVSDLMKVTKSNLKEAWQKGLNMLPPENILKALGE